MDITKENTAGNLCLLAAGVPERDVIGKLYRTRLGAVAEVIACNPRAAHYQWTLLIGGKKVKCGTSDIDWASGPVYIAT